MLIFLVLPLAHYLHFCRPDIQAIVHTHTTAITAVSALASGLRFYTQDSCEFYGKVGYHDYEGLSTDPAECGRLAEALGPNNHTLFLRNHGAVTTGASIGEAWVRMYYLDRICKVQLEVMKARGGGGTGEDLPIDPELCAKVQEQFRAFVPGAYEWKALIEYAERTLTKHPL